MRKSETRICCSHIHLAPIEEAAKTLREAEGKESSKENFDDTAEQLSSNQSWNHHTSILSAIVLLSRQLSLWISIPGAENILTDPLTIVILPHIFLFQLFFLASPSEIYTCRAHMRVCTHTHTEEVSL